MVKLFTGVGDQGKTCVIDGCVQKDDPRIEAVGSVDELNSSIGFALSFQTSGITQQVLERVQDHLFIIGAEIASAGQENARVPKLEKKHVDEIEKDIHALEKQLDKQKFFVLPRGTQAASALHLSRAIARRAERDVLRVKENAHVNPDLLVYLNRVSSLLYGLALLENKMSGFKEKPPSYK